MKLIITVTFQPATDASELGNITFPLMDKILKGIRALLEISPIAKYLDEILFKIEK